MVNQIKIEKSPTLEKEIESAFPKTITPEQIQRFSREVERLQKIKEFFKKYPEDKQQFAKQLKIAEKYLDYKRPYRIAMIGMTGEGKSTLLNAILGRPLVLMKDTGDAATGCVLEIFLDVKVNEEETATVFYRNQDDIKKLIKNNLLDPYINDNRDNTEDSHPSGDPRLKNRVLDMELAQEIQNLNPARNLNDDEKEKFQKLKQELVKIIQQYANNDLETFRTEYSLSNDNDVKDLENLIDEHSEINLNPDRGRISLVKTIKYQIKPMVDGHLQTLTLPNNVCLVDLPGLDGTPLHNIIITEGIQEADAVISLINPRKVNSGNQTYINNRVKQYFNLENNVEAGERIFLVLTKRDAITTDYPEPPGEAMKRLMDSLHPQYKIRFATKAGDKPYFFISAWAALNAQRSIRGDVIQDQVFYKTTREKLGVSTSTYDSTEQDRELLEKSEVPKLVEALIIFAREFRIERQIEDGKNTLENMIRSLSTEYEFEKRRLPANYSQSYIQQKLELQLRQKQYDLELIVTKFRAEQLNNFPAINNLMKQEVGKIYSKVNNVIKKKMVQIWEENFQAKIDPLDTKAETLVFFKSILGELQINLWEQLTIYLPELSDKLVSFYGDALEKYQMASKITSYCYGYLQREEIEQTIQELVEHNMRHTMVNIASRIAVTEMTEPKYYFDDLQKEENQPLLRILKEIRPQQELGSDKFNGLIQQVGKLYENVVSSYSISRLLNLYRYEMITIEKHLLSRIKDVFQDLRTSGNPILMAEINENLDPQLIELQKLEAKIADLNKLKESYGG